MHVLGHGFSQRRKTSKPRDLHIRKVSFSGCSLSSGSSLSTSPSVSDVSSASSLSPPSMESVSYAPPSSRSPAHGFDPLALHPTFMPPPRLCDRPLLSSPERRRFDESTTFFMEGDEEQETAQEYYYGRYDDKEAAHHISIAHCALHGEAYHAREDEPSDDYLARLPTRGSALPRSRWSDSTVASVESIMSQGDSETVDGDDDDRLAELAEEGEEPVVAGDLGNDDDIDRYYLEQSQDGHQLMPNFSYKRVTMAKRPPIKTLDSLEDFIKRGGWKRRGVIFNSEDMKADSVPGMSF